MRNLKKENITLQCMATFVLAAYPEHCWDKTELGLRMRFQSKCSIELLAARCGPSLQRSYRYRHSSKASQIVLQETLAPLGHSHPTSKALQRLD